ncbi:MAG: branched-chain-amino-acid transaminase [Brevinema sp.]
MSSYSINGVVCDDENAKVSILDRGILYGDGIFEGIRMYHRHVFKLDEHLIRLYESADLLDLHIPISRKEFTEEVLTTARAFDGDSAYVRITVSRYGSIGLYTTPDMQVNRSVTITPLNYQKTETYNKGLYLINVPLVRIPNNALPMRAKTLNYLNNILAVNKAKKMGADDALLLNTDGYVAESSGSNIFYIKDNKLVTPSVDAGILVGVTRNCIISLAKNIGLEVIEKLFNQNELETADEIFLTGTAMEIMPVYKINDTIIGNGLPGTHTKVLMQGYKNHIIEVPGYSV